VSNPPEPTPAEARARFRTTLGRVLIVQLVSMIVLGLIQILYSR
jgi:hypothetical protein